MSGFREKYDLKDDNDFDKFQKNLYRICEKREKDDTPREEFDRNLTETFQAAVPSLGSDEIPDQFQQWEPLVKIHLATKPVIKTVEDRWAARNLLIYNLGAMAGMYGFTLGAVYWGRRMTFTIFMTGCIIFTSATFLFMNSPMTQLLLVPPMGFFLMSMFGGYTIYFPELFPTRLRSTGVSFCYNVGRYVAACGPLMLGILTTAFAGFATPEDSTLPFRYAGVTMCSIFILGIIVVWFLPETKGKPLPE